MVKERQAGFAGKSLMLAVFAIGGVLLLGNASSVYACMCGKASTCERFNFHKTIFVGKAIGIDKAQKGTFNTETTVFEIQEMFSGEKFKTIRVQNKSGFSCDVEFTVGETYLVFAGGDKKEGFGTGFCSGNLPIQFASAEIAELRTLSGSTGNGRLIGTVLEESTKRTPNEKRTPISDVRLQITELATGRNYTVRTDTKGQYEIAVPPGKYTVTPVAPSNSILSNLFQVEPMEIRSGGCSKGFFVLANDSVVAGRLLDAEGKPAPYVRVELVSVEKGSSYLGGESDESDLNGYFEIKQVPAGKYTLSINYNSNPDPERPFPTTFYPSGGERSQADTIEIGFGSRLEGINWRLPPRLIEKAFAGNVVWEDGSPAVGAEIKLFDLAFPGFYAGCYLLQNRDKSEDISSPVRSTSIRMSGPACEIKSDSNGRFRLSGYSGRTYQLSASISKVIAGQRIEYSGESESFSLIDAPPSIKLILRRQ